MMMKQAYLGQEKKTEHCVLEGAPRNFHFFLQCAYLMLKGKFIKKESQTLYHLSIGVQVYGIDLPSL